MATQLAEAPTGAQEDDQVAGQDPDAGKLFEVPRVAIVIDETDPTVIKLAISGAIELDRAQASDVALFNRLKEGSEHELRVSGFVAGGKTRHRRDSEGDVDAVVATKSLIITDVYVLTPEEL